MSKNKNGKKKSKKKVIIIVAIVVVGGIFVIKTIGNAFKSVSEGMQSALEAMNEQALYKVERQDVEQEITTSGDVIGLEEDAYISAVTAKVQDLLVEVGQTVHKGDVLLTYDASELGDNLEKVKIQAQSERAAGNESFEAADKAAGKASAASAKVKKLKDEVDRAKTDIEEINDEITMYQDTLEETEKKNAKEETAAATPSEEGTTRQANTEDTSDLKEKIRSLNKQLTKKNEVLADKQTQLAEQESIEKANKDVSVSNSVKAQVSASNQLSNLNVNNAQDSYNKAEAGITAKSDGIIKTVNVLKGAYANETQTVLTMVDTNKIGVEFSISKDDLGSISKGQSARIVIGSQQYQGTVDYISRVASDPAMSVSGSGSSTGSIKGRIVIDEPDDNLYIGVSAKVYIFVGKAENALVVPYEALNTDIKGDYVYVVDGENKIQRKDITVGICSDEYYEVTQGLEEGDQVITEVTKDMKPGDVYVPDMSGMAAQ